MCIYIYIYIHTYIYFYLYTYILVITLLPLIIIIMTITIIVVTTSSRTCGPRPRPRLPQRRGPGDGGQDLVVLQPPRRREEALLEDSGAVGGLHAALHLQHPAPPREPEAAEALILYYIMLLQYIKSYYIISKYSIVQYSMIDYIKSCYIILYYSIVQYSIVQYSVVWYNTLCHVTVQYSVVLAGEGADDFHGAGVFRRHVARASRDARAREKVPDAGESPAGYSEQCLSLKWLEPIALHHVRYHSIHYVICHRVVFKGPYLGAPSL